MTQDVAALGFSIDSSQAITAGRNLDGLRGSADGASRSTQLLVLQHAEHRAALVQLSQATQSLNKDFSDTETALDALIRKLDDSRAALSKLFSNGGGFPDFSKLQQQVEQVGQTFGVTSTALEGYYRTAQNLSFTTSQTVSSITRITEALQNQSLVGQQVRRVLQDYGVEVSGKTAADSAAVLQSFVEQLRQTKDSAQKFRSVQQVLGPIDTDTFGKINSSDYVSIDEQRSRKIQAATDEKVQTSTRNAALLTRQADSANAKYADLSQHYNLGNGDAIGGLDSDQRAQLAKLAGVAPASNTLSGLRRRLLAGTSQNDQTKELEYLQANPTSDLAKAAANIPALIRSQGVDTASTRLIRDYRNGTIDANAEEIKARYEGDRQNSGTLTATGNLIGRRLSNAFNLYDPLPPITDQRKGDKLDEYLQSSGTANALAGYGDTGFQRRLNATQGLIGFSLDANGKPTNDQTKDTFKNLTGAYGGIEGYQRFEQIRGGLQNEKDNALNPGADALNAGSQEAFLLALPREQRGKAQNYLDFARQNRVPTQQFIENANAGGDQVGELDRITTPNVEFGPGALDHSQGTAFQAITKQSDANAYAASRVQFLQTLDDQQKLTAAAGQGAEAVEDQTAKNDAYNQSMAKRNNTTQAQLEQDQAVFLLAEKRKTQITQTITLQEQQNKVEADRIASVGAVSGADPTVRAAAITAAQLTADFAKAKNNNSALADPTLAAKEQATLRAAAGNQATSAANDIVAKDQQSLKAQQDLLAVANSRADVQAKFARNQQVDLEFAQSLGQAEAINDQARVAAITRQITDTKTLRDQVALLNQEAKNFKIGRDARDSAAYDLEASKIVDPQARRAFIANKQNVQDNRGNPGGNGPIQPSDYKNNNPTNLEYYPGQQGVQGKNGRFGTYATPEDGIGAGLQQMLLDQSRGFDTITKEITRRSPPTENDTAGLIRKMSALTGFGPDQKYDLHDPATAQKFLTSNITLETGKAPSADLVTRGVGIGLTGQSGAASQQARQDGLTDQENNAATLGVVVGNDQRNAQRAAQDRARKLAGSPGDAARAGADYIDPTANAITAQNDRDVRLTDVQRSQQQQAATTSAASQQKAADDRRAADAAYNSARSGVDDLASSSAEARRSQVASEQRQLGSGTVDPAQRNAELLSEQSGALGKTIGDTSATTKVATEDAIKLADAWKRGTAAALEQQRALETEPIERQIQAMQKQGVNVDALTAKYQALVAQKTADARATQDKQIYTQVSGLKDQDALATNDNEQSIFSSNEAIARNRAIAAAQQKLANESPDASPQAKTDLLNAVNTDQDVKERTATVQSYRDAWKSAEDATTSALNSFIVNGGSAKDVLSGLLKSLSSVLLSLAEAPLKKAGGDWLSSLLGGGKAAAGASGAFDGAGEAASAFDGAGTAALAVGAGGAWVGGVRMMAAGGVLDRPTTFMAAGGTTLAGEMGSEAIMPLRRMPNGNLGIAASGGGGGGVSVNAPITITGGQSQNGKMDPAVTAAIQQQLAESVRVAVVQGIAQEKRPGGSLY